MIKGYKYDYVWIDEPEANMEKYGVELDPSKEKTADGGGRRACPICGQELEKSEGVYLNKCPSHGTEPFEHKK